MPQRLLLSGSVADDRHGLSAIRSDLVRLLYSTFFPTLLMGTAAATICLILAARDEGEARLQLLLAAGLAALTAGRLGLILLFRERTGLFAFEKWEKFYAAGSFLFSLTIGLVGMEAFWSRDPQAQVLAIALLFAYSAGVIARVSVRPWIAITTLLIAVLPFVLGIAANGDTTAAGLYILLLLMFAAGIETVLHTHRVTREHLVTRARFADLARNDPLTGLANRLLLEERIEAHLAQRAAGDVALHYIDLDRFKEVNDRYGHPVGDALLRAVATRLAGLLRRSDFAARLGGDEFVVIQADVPSPEEAVCLGRRIVASLSESYDLIGQEVRIGASVGVSISSERSPLADLMAQADEALYAAKRAGRGTVVLHTPRQASEDAAPIL